MAQPQTLAYSKASGPVRGGRFAGDAFAGALALEELTQFGSFSGGAPVMVGEVVLDGVSAAGSFGGLSRFTGATALSNLTSNGAFAIAPATMATLSGSATGTTGVASTFTVTLNGAVPAGGGTVSIAASGATLSASTLTFSAGGASFQTFTVTRATDGTTSVSITNSMSLTVVGSPISYTSASTLLGSDWSVRSTAAGVVWAHNFERDEEVTAHLSTSTPERTIVAPRRVVDSSGIGCLEQLIIGGELAAPYTAGAATMTLTDPDRWPDPAVIGSYYVMACHQYPEALAKNLFMVTAISGNVISVTYVPQLLSPFSSTQQSYAAGDYIGNEEMRQWIRTFSPLIAGENGLLTNDPADGGAVGLRSKLSTGAYGVPRDVSLWGYGNYCHPDNQTTWQNWTPWEGAANLTARGPVNGAADKYKVHDGSEFWIAFKQKIDPDFFTYHVQPYIAATGGTGYWSRKGWAIINEVSTYNELVTSISPSGFFDIPATNPNVFSLNTNKATAQIGRTDHAGRTNGSSQYGGAWHVSPWYADNNNGALPATGAPTPDGAGAFEYRADEWIDWMVRVKPGHSQANDTEIDVWMARTEDPAYNGTWTKVLAVTDAKINFSSSGDYVYPNGSFSYPTLPRMDSLPGFSAFWWFGYLNIWQDSNSNPPPRHSYYHRLAQVIFSRQVIAPPLGLPTWVPAPGEMKRLTVGGGVLTNNFRSVVAPYFYDYFDTALVNDYSGMCLAPDIGSYGALVVYGGGHGATASNNSQVMALVPGFSGLSWVSLTNPHAWTGSTATDVTNRSNNSLMDITPLVDMNWGDVNGNEPPGIHSYASNVVIPHANGGAANGTLFSVIVAAGGTVNLPTSGGSHELPIVSETTPASNVWARVGAYLGANGWGGPIVAAYVPAQDRVYYAVGSGGGSNVRWFDRATDTHNVGHANGMTPSNDYNSGQYIYVESRGLILHVDRIRASSIVRVRWMDVSVSNPQLGGTATLSATLPTIAFAANWACAAWCPDTNRLIFGQICNTPGGTPDDAAVYEVEIPATLTDPWTVTRRVTTGVTNIGWDATPTWQQPIYMPAIKCWVLFQRASKSGNDDLLVYRPLGT